jgi:TP901-1 family phage major tail protein
MAQQTGRGLLIKKGDGGTVEVFTTVCGLLARSFSVNNNTVDVTVPDCIVPTGRVIESMVYGVQSLQFSGSGLFDNDIVGKAVSNAALNQTLSNYQIIVPGWGTFQGSFIIESLSFSGDKEGNLEFEATWRLSGAVTFTAE